MKIKLSDGITIEGNNGDYAVFLHDDKGNEYFLSQYEIMILFKREKAGKSSISF